MKGGTDVDVWMLTFRVWVQASSQACEWSGNETSGYTAGSADERGFSGNETNGCWRTQRGQQLDVTLPRNLSCFRVKGNMAWQMSYIQSTPLSTSIWVVKVYKHSSTQWGQRIQNWAAYTAIWHSYWTSTSYSAVVEGLLWHSWSPTAQQLLCNSHRGISLHMWSTATADF